MLDHSRGRNADADDDEVEPFGGLVRYERHVPLHQVSYYLCGELQAPQYYTELFYTLRSAAETDLIYLHINSPGGDFNTGLQIINNMLASDAHVVTVLEARAYSMAAFIFLTGDELIVHDNCQLMFHTYSSSFAGKGSEQLAEVHALGSWFEKVTTRLCTPFLSTTDINHILQGSDLWMDSDEIRRRLARIKPARTKATPRKPAVRKSKTPA
ncbi:MAG: Clp protease ClpP [Zoogloea sp.]|uniref:Clp protease ClpP n=1 Tax=Zoogloea sp. TaxID=49181 RepID=UPI0026053BE7|nr:Clp protease ClpP [Zoogloea sp.]MDD2988179.1 Clp protease ClpP [Zoogloea sp.]